MFFAALIVLLAFSTWSADACFSCPPRRPGESIADNVCRHHLALRAKVVNITDEPFSQARGIPMRIYEIESKKVFRNQLNVQPAPTEIYTNTPFAMDSCSQYFEVGKEYLIFADRKTNSQFYTDTCYNNKLWSEMPSNVVQGLEGGLYANCTSRVVQTA